MDQRMMILLTYKRKVLLACKDLILPGPQPKFWHFIVGAKDKNQSSEENMKKVVQDETGITLDNLELISQNQKESFYHTHLTDENVNNIVRAEGKILEFFSLKELGGLSLSILTKLLITKHKDLLEKADAA
ncbi:hypothetical protein C4559_02345 [Candidatus Microgenomates bacterium]|nr:MAG: hypothetical protein C4559_02345 [Candidatus Microgenomates bacterium]